MLETLQYTTDGEIATVAFHRPAAMNSFDKKMADELEMVTDEIRKDTNTRVLLLKGAGHLFMAGGDIRFFYDNLENMPKGVMKIVRTLNASIENLMAMPKPVVASVHGSVAGVGMSFMMACDLVIAAESTKFTMAYSGLGISADGGASFNLPKIVGPKKAMEWMLLSELIDAKTALQHGLVNWVVKDEALIDETLKLVQRLKAGPTRSYAHIKQLINQSWTHSLSSHLESEGKAFEDCSQTSDFRNGVAAFLSKKRPEFSGN